MSMALAKDTESPASFCWSIGPTKSSPLSWGTIVPFLRRVLARRSQGGDRRRRVSDPRKRAGAARAAEGSQDAVAGPRRIDWREVHQSHRAIHDSDREVLGRQKRPHPRGAAGDRGCRCGIGNGEFDVKRVSIPTADPAPMEWYTFVVLVLFVAIGAMVSIALWLER